MAAVIVDMAAERVNVVVAATVAIMSVAVVGSVMVDMIVVTS
jgi:hypothetical protein